MLTSIYINDCLPCHEFLLKQWTWANIYWTRNAYLCVCVSIYFASVCVCVCTCMRRKVCFVRKGGTEWDLNQLCAGLCRLWGVAGWGRTCRACVWEPCAPHFSDIVLLLLQTVNATKDAQPIVAWDRWGRRAMGRRQAREEGFGRQPGMAAMATSPPFVSSSVLSPLCSYPLLFSSFLFSLHSVLPLSPSQEDLAWLDLAADAYHTKELNKLKFKLSLLVRYS